MRKIYFYIIASTLILLTLIGISVFNTRKNNVVNTQNNSPTPTSITDLQQQTLFPTLTQEEIVQLQSDRETGEWTQQVYNSYPWYNQLPLMNDKYFVYFDINQKKFIATLYVAGEEETLKNEILQQLKSLDINYEQFEITWEIQST